MSELDAHRTQDEGNSYTDTVVILHDSCYGHRFSRPHTTKASLNTIFERPERIHASILGISAAYVRLSGRHKDGKYTLNSEKDSMMTFISPFQIRKTTRKLELSSQAVTKVHGEKWMEELKLMCQSAESKLALNRNEVARPEIGRGTEQNSSARLHEGDLYLCSESLNAMEGAIGAVCEGVDSVFRKTAECNGPRRSFVAIRPPGHHCSTNYPSGFCWVNNVHVGISYAALTHGLTHAAIIDFDLHHGDGSQAIAWENNNRALNATKNAPISKKSSIGYFSLHDINSYPCEMGDEEKVKNACICISNAHGQNIWNVHLQPWKSEQEFWELYESKYSVILDKAREYLRAQNERLKANTSGPKPRGAIFLSAGFDASEWESSGMQRHKVNVPTEFYARLTRDVVKIAEEEDTAVDGRVISVLEGGYSDRALLTGVFSHLSGLTNRDSSAANKNKKIDNTLPQTDSINTLCEDQPPENKKVSENQIYDPAWWSLPCIQELENLKNATASEPNKQKTSNSSFSSPTQSFMSKVTSPAALRTISEMSNFGIRSAKPTSKTAPPCQEVCWAHAAHELSKLLVPTGRQTLSYNSEELSPKKSRVNKDFQTIQRLKDTETVTEIPGRMALRARKPTKSVEPLGNSPTKNTASKLTRRKTVAVIDNISTKTANKTEIMSRDAKHTNNVTQPQRRPRLVPTQSSDSTFSKKNRPTPAIETENFKTNRPIIPSIANSTSRSDFTLQTSLPARRNRKPRKLCLDIEEVKVGKKRMQNSSPSCMEPPDLVNSDLSPRTARKSPPASDQPLKLESTSISDDIDKLTSSMSKIKISLVTKSQRAAREKNSGQKNPIRCMDSVPMTKAKPSLDKNLISNHNQLGLSESSSIISTEVSSMQTEADTVITQDFGQDITVKNEGPSLILPDLSQISLSHDSSEKYIRDFNRNSSLSSSEQKSIDYDTFAMNPIDTNFIHGYKIEKPIKSVNAENRETLNEFPVIPCENMLDPPLQGYIKPSTQGKDQCSIKLDSLDILGLSTKDVDINSLDTKVQVPVDFSLEKTGLSTIDNRSIEMKITNLSGESE
ncbi:histone deacetylase HosB [Blumeria hordei DH14]|uniref:Histone deacetylase HosB n=1 Tax=Blumeria graminis f. sp. hordei (strain DH14) TaxID=546991 RepID=N1J5F7_BLUG1|nr:histone deacetylase HosB [Blumeria hordei DH14]